MKRRIGIIIYVLFIVLALIINSLLINAIDKSSDVKTEEENRKALLSH